MPKNEWEMKNTVFWCEWTGRDGPIVAMEQCYREPGGSCHDAGHGNNDYCTAAPKLEVQDERDPPVPCA